MARCGHPVRAVTLVSSRRGEGLGLGGCARCGKWTKQYVFTGKEREQEWGLVYFGARWLNPALGRWMSVDPEALSGGEAAYGYVENDPLARVDPDGMDDIVVVTVVPRPKSLNAAVWRRTVAAYRRSREENRRHGRRVHFVSARDNAELQRKMRRVNVDIVEHGNRKIERVILLGHGSDKGFWLQSNQRESAPRVVLRPRRRSRGRRQRRGGGNHRGRRQQPDSSNAEIYVVACWVFPSATGATLSPGQEHSERRSALAARQIAGRGDAPIHQYIRYKAAGARGATVYYEPDGIPDGTIGGDAGDTRTDLLGLPAGVPLNVLVQRHKAPGANTPEANQGWVERVRR